MVRAGERPSRCSGAGVSNKANNLKANTMKPTAIIADDEQHLAAFLKDRLAALWPELSIVATAANGPEALRFIDDHVPDIVFLDTHHINYIPLHDPKYAIVNGNHRAVFAQMFAAAARLGVANAFRRAFAWLRWISF